MTLKRALIGLLVIAVLLAGAVFAYNRFFALPQDEPAATATTATPGSDRIAAPASTGRVSAEGHLVPLRHAAVAFTVGGVVEEILAPAGTAVTAGQPILRLDAADQRAALRGAEAALALARAERDAAAARLEAAALGITAAELGVRAAESELALASAAPRPEDIALGESAVALAGAQVAAATAAQAQLLEGAGAARVQAAEADLRAAEAAVVPARLHLEQLRAQDNPDADDLTEAERAYNAALAAVEAAQVALDNLRDGATAAQQSAASSGVAAATARQDAAQADLDLLLAGGSAGAIAAAEANRDGARAALAEAKARHAAAEAAVGQAEAGVVGAEAALAAAQTALDDRTLVAPFDGVVADLPAAVGEVAQAGAPAAVVADFSGWLIETTDLIERDVVGVAAGRPVEVTVDALPGERLTGVVQSIGGISQQTQGDTTYPVTIRLDDPGDLPLRWGMTTFVSIDPESGSSTGAEPAAHSGDISAEGQLLPRDEADLAFTTGGIVAGLLAAEGQAVAAGDAIIRLDDAAATAALAQAEAGLAAAEAARASARAGTELAATGQQTAEATLAAAEAALAQAQAGARPEEILAAERELAAAEAGVARAAAERDAATEVSSARVSAAEAQLAAAYSRMTALQATYDTIVTTCVTLPDGSETCPLLGPPEQTTRAQVEAAEASYAAAQLALAEARAGATAGERQVADAAVAVAAAQRDVAAAQLALLRAGARPESIELAGIGVEQARLGIEQAAVAGREAAAALAQAEAGVTSAGAAVDAARAALARMTLVAPFAGTVAVLDVELGELVAPGVPVVRLGSAGQWVVETTDLVEQDVVGLAEGQEVVVTLDALPDETLRGTIVDIGRVPETAHGDVVYRVRVALDAYPDLPLRWGMTATVTNDE